MKSYLVPVLLCLIGTCLAELPPSAYEAMQAKATDYVSMEVLQVNVENGKEPDQKQVRIMALVDSIERSSSHIKAGDVINIIYTVTAHPDGWSGPRETPILKERDKCVAYLSPIENTPNFRPVAGAMSFRNF